MNLQLGYTPLTGFTLKAYQPDHLSGFLTIPNLEAGFPLRCFQRLSIPDIATEQCPWQDSSYTRGQFTPVLSSRDFSHLSYCVKSSPISRSADYIFIRLHC